MEKDNHSDSSMDDETQASIQKTMKKILKGELKKLLKLAEEIKDIEEEKSIQLGKLVFDIDQELFNRKLWKKSLRSKGYWKKMNFLETILHGSVLVKD